MTINVEEKLLHRFKVKTVTEGTTMGDVLVKAINAYLGPAVEAKPTRPAKKKSRKR